MKVPKDCAQIYVSVFTEKEPPDVMDFEQKIDKYIIQQKGTRSIYSYYEHGLYEKIQNTRELVDKIEHFFGDLGKTRFEMKRYSSEDVGKMVVVEWKNPRYNPCSRMINHLVINKMVM